LVRCRNIKLHPAESIKIRDPLTGELREYHSLDEVPEAFREQIRKLRESAASAKGANVITVTDSTGKLQTYRSIDELPPELRAFYVRQKNLGQKNGRGNADLRTVVLARR
jgi:hypothetical protein